MRPILALTAVLAAGVAGAAEPTFPSSAGNLTVETIASGLAHPWSLAFLPDGRMLVTERPGRMRIVTRNGQLSQPLGGVPAVFAQSPGRPDGCRAGARLRAQPHHLCLLCRARRWRRAHRCLARAADRWRNTAARFADDNIPAERPGLARPQYRLPHGAGAGRQSVRHPRRSFRPEALAQNLDNHIGKIVRITPDGAAPPDNPFVGQQDALPEIWAYGLRNAEGLAFNPADGKLWEQEHGPMGGDEINIIEKGKNYGWPLVSYGVNYDGTPVGNGKATMDGVADPLWHWTPSIAPSGMAFYTGDLFPGWKGSLFNGALKFELISRLELKGDKAVKEERLLQDLHERIRDVRQGPDGALYLLTDNSSGRILRLCAGEMTAGSPCRLNSPFVKHEEGAGRDQCKAETLAQRDRLAQIEERENGEHREGDHLLHRLELGRGVHGAAEAIGRHRHAVFDEREPPADEDDRNQRHLLVAQVPVPGGGHEDVGPDQQKNGREIRRQNRHWAGILRAGAIGCGLGLAAQASTGKTEMSPWRHGRALITPCACLCCVRRIAPFCGPVGCPSVPGPHFFCHQQPVLGFPRGPGCGRARLALVPNRERYDAHQSSDISIAALLIAGATTAMAQNPPRGQQPPPPPKAGPYKPVTVTPPHRRRPQLRGLPQTDGRSRAAQRSRRACEAIVGQGFFWLREKGDRADKKKSGIDNLAAALGLNNKDGAGWDMLASFADDPTGAASPEQKGATCAPADPNFDRKAFEALMQSTQTDLGDWGYPVSADIEVRAAPQANAPVVEKLGSAFVRIIAENGPNVPTFLRVVTPSGKTGFVSVDSVAPIGNDQICYAKDASGWKIGGYIGGGDAP